MFGRKLTASELDQYGLANRTFPSSTFHADLNTYLRQQLASNDATSILLTKKLMAGPLKRKRMEGVTDAMNVIADRLREGAPQRMFEKRQIEMFGKKAKI
jgi:peroxisomal 3,2-trans-enoyl-CoA isomerase